MLNSSENRIAEILQAYHWETTSVSMNLLDSHGHSANAEYRGREIKLQFGSQHFSK